MTRRFLNILLIVSFFIKFIVFISGINSQVILDNNVLRRTRPVAMSVEPNRVTSIIENITLNRILSNKLVSLSVSDDAKKSIMTVVLLKALAPDATDFQMQAWLTQQVLESDQKIIDIVGGLTLDRSLIEFIRYLYNPTFLNTCLSSDVLVSDFIVGLRKLIESLGGDLSSIKEKGALVFDIDRTLLFKKREGFDEEMQLEIITSILAQLLSNDLRIALTSTNEVHFLFARLVNDEGGNSLIFDKLKEMGVAHKIKNLTLYANGPATRVNFSSLDGQLTHTTTTVSVGERELRVEGRDVTILGEFFNQLMKSEKLVNMYVEAVKEVLNRENIDGPDNLEALVKTSLKQAMLEEVRKNWSSDLQLGDGSKINVGISWIEDPGNFQGISVIDSISRTGTEKEIINITVDDGELAANESKDNRFSGPWLEIRGNNGDYVQMTLKPLPSVLTLEVDGREVEIRLDGVLQHESLRDKIIDLIEQDGSILFTYPHLRKYNFRGGGTTSIDIGVEKNHALTDYIVTNRLEEKFIIYLGDEFHYRGGDNSVLLFPGINVLSVGGRLDEATKQLIKDGVQTRNGVVVDPNRIQVIGDSPIQTWILMEYLKSLGLITYP